MFYFLKKDYRIGIGHRIDDYHENNLNILYVLNFIIKVIGIKFLYHLIMSSFRLNILVIYYAFSFVKDYFIIKEISS